MLETSLYKDNLFSKKSDLAYKYTGEMYREWADIWVLKSLHKINTVTMSKMADVKPSLEKSRY